MKRYFCILLFFFQIYSLFSQNRLTNIKVIDSITEKPIAFANILFDNSKSDGTITGIDGTFFLDTFKIKNIAVSYVGYQTKKINVNQIRDKKIKLKEFINQLDEVQIISKENQAKIIIKKVIENKKYNNPKNIKTFTFTSYNKVVFDFLNKVKDSTKKEFSNKHIFMSETVSKAKFLHPNFTENVILGTKASGFKHPTFATLSTDIQPFSFYDDIVKLFDVNFLNPISKGSTKKYKFRLEDTFYNKKDTVFIISFRPKSNKNFEGLKGLLYINSNKYAIQSVDAKPFKKMKVNIKIQQKYSFLNDKHWFPKELNYEVTFGKDSLGIISFGKSYISNVVFEKNLRKKDFGMVSVKYSKGATKKNNSFWNLYRSQKLNQKELNTYKFLDSLGEKHHFDDKLHIVESLVDNKLKLGYFDLDLKQSLVFNKFENVRLGLGLYTNDNLIKNISAGGFFGYGFRDKKWKYGGEIIFNLSDKREFNFALRYQNSLREVATNNLISNLNMFNTRDLIAYRMDKIEEYNARVNIKTSKDMNWSFQYSNTKITPKYSYLFDNGNELISEFTNSEIKVNLRYSVNAHVVNSFSKTINLPTNYPVFNFTYSKGMKNMFKGMFNYNKYEFNIEHSFTTKEIGITSYRLELGYADRSLPYSLLFTGEGSLDAELPIIVKNNFQTLEPYEFLSNFHINFFSRQNFGSLLFKKNNFQPDIILHNNFGYGNLINSNKHKNISFKLKDKIFSETGLEFRNVLKFNYLNIGSIGFGTGVFYRYGFYHLPKVANNFRVKFVMSFSIK